jgi:hypothetical protein
MGCAVGGLGTWSTGGSNGSSDMDGKGGRNSGICSGGSQFDERRRFRVGDEGFDMGDRGRGGEDCLEGGLLRMREGVLAGGISSSIVYKRSEWGSSSIVISSSSPDSH